jgi:subtilase family serine protease
MSPRPKKLLFANLKMGVCPKFAVVSPPLLITWCDYGSGVHLDSYPLSKQTSADHKENPMLRKPLPLPGVFHVLQFFLAVTLATCFTAGNLNAQSFNYDTNPPNQFAFAAAKPAQFPTPSQCVAAFGLACYTPALIRTAYDIPSTFDGTGQTIVIVDAYGSPTVRSDLHIFDLVFGLPDPELNIIYPGGSPVYNPLQHHNEMSWANETSLDVQWAHAIAPGATIDLVIAANNGGDVLNNAVRYAIDHRLGNVISLSWGTPESAIRGNGNNAHLMQAHQNFLAAQAASITVFASAGDNGASNGASFPNALYPASDPLVTSVGGTNLFMDDSGNYLSEDVWNDSDPALCPFGCLNGIFGATGGSPSLVFSAPSFQQAVSGNSMRSTSDVSYNASVYTGILVYLGFPPAAQQGFYFFGGTSEGAPQWAAITALADQAAGHALGYLSPSLYAISLASFHDVTVGQNSFNGPGFPAKPGYDYPTGLGSPDVANLILALTGK